VSALLFCFHPVHVEAVASLVGRADSLCGLLFLLALYFYTRLLKEQDELKVCKDRRLAVLTKLSFYHLVAYLAAFAACFAKEIGATVFGVLCVVEVCSCQLQQDGRSLYSPSSGSCKKSFFLRVVNGTRRLLTAILDSFLTSISCARILCNISLLLVVLFLRIKINGPSALYKCTVYIIIYMHSFIVQCNNFFRSFFS
jgi:hypothetical protein